MKASEQVRKNIRENIKFYRETKGITQKELANELYMDESLISKIEIGTRDVFAYELKIIADYFGRTTEDFYSAVSNRK